MSSETAPPEGGKRRPILKWGLIAIAALLALIFVLLLALRFAAQSSFGREFVETRIEAADPSGQEIEIEGLTGDLLGRFRIERLTVADEDGIWLVAENVLADWKPFALRRRALLIEALEADLIHVQRRPIIQSSDSSGGGGGSMPLRSGALDTLRIGELRTDEGVLPRALSLEINGEGRIGQNGGRTLLSVLPIDGDGDRLEADLTWSDDMRVQGALDLDGPAGGLFASLAQLEAGQSLAASLEADGTLDEWTGNAAVEVDGSPALQAEARSDEGVIAFDLSAFLTRHPLTANVANTLGDTITVEGRYLGQNDDAALLDLTANAEGLQLIVQADRPQSGAYSADVQLNIDQPTRYAGNENLSVESAILDGTLVYDEGAARFDGHVEAREVDVPSFSAATVSGPLSAVYDSPSITVRTTLTGEESMLPGMAGQIAGQQPSLQLNAQYALDNGTLSLRETLLRGRAGRVSAAGTIRLSPSLSADLAGSFSVNGETAGLARPIKLDGQFQANRAQPDRTNFQVTTNARDFGALPAPLNQWSDGTARLNARGNLAGDGALQLSALSLRSGTLALDGSGSLSADQRLTAEADLTAGAATISGYALDRVNGRVAVSGPLSNLQFQTRLNVPSLSSDSLSFSDIALIGDGRYSEGALSATARLDAGTSNAPLAARTGLSLDGGAWQVENFEGSWGNLEATASLSGNGGDLASIRGDAAINGDLPDGLPAQSVTLDAQLRGEQILLDAALQTLSFGPTEADALIVRASGVPDNVDFVLEMEGQTELNALSYETAVNLDGTVTGLASGAPDLTASLSAILGDIGFVSEEPIRYTQYDDGFDANASFAALGGTLSPRITTRGETSIRVQGENLRIAPLLVIAGRPGLEGALTLDVDFNETEGGGLAGPFRAELASIARAGSDLPPVDLSVSGDLQPDQMAINVRADDNDALEATIDATLPVNTQDTLPFITPQPGAEIPFEAQMDGQIEAISALVVPPQMVLRGLIDLQMSGRLPKLNDTFNGQLDFTEGEFEHGDLGMVLNTIEASAQLGAGSVELTRFSANGRSGGTLSGSGTMAIDGSAQSDVQIEADELVVTERREGRATVSGTMELRQTPDLFEVVGDLTVDEGEINIDNLPSGGPATLDVNFDEPVEEEEAEEEEAATRLDIQLNAPGQIDIRGRGANAELALDADIRGSFGEPVITGEATIVRGRFDLIGKRFQFSESTVTLVPEIGQSPLNISARHETRDDVVAILSVDGTIDRPDITLTSEPVLPEDEVLSRVLFGRSPSQLTALETARLAAALTQLSGGGGFDLLGGIERALGLDTFDVGSGTEGGVQVTSGKYLTDNVYLELRTGNSSSPGVAIEWEPVTNIEVEAATSTEEGQQLSVQWKRDFDDGVFPGVSGNKTSADSGSRGRADGNVDPEVAGESEDVLEEDNDLATAPSETAVDDDTAPVTDGSD